jgi:hypothetical protein
MTLTTSFALSHLMHAFDLNHHHHTPYK